MRCVNNDGSGLFGKKFFKSVEVRLECLRVRRDDDELAVIVAHIAAVLQKIRRECDDFLARVQDRLQDHVQRAAGADRHDDIMLGIGSPESSVQGFGNGISRGLKSCIAHVTVHAVRGLFVQDVDDRIHNGLRRRDIGIPEAEIVDILIPVDAFEPRAFLEHFADSGIVGYKRFHFFGYHPGPLS